MITHDRAFLDRITTRIVELDRGVLRSYPGNFAAYEARKTEELAAEDVTNRRFDKFWAQEEVWIRKGVEARRTRNEGRVKRLERLRVERAERRERLGNVKLSLDAGERSGKLVAELENVIETVRRAHGAAQRFHAHHARRSRRAHRAQWRGQVDADSGDPRAARSRTAARCASAPTCRLPTSISCASSSMRSAPLRTRSARVGLG